MLCSGGPGGQTGLVEGQAEALQLLAALSASAELLRPTSARAAQDVVAVDKKGLTANIRFEGVWYTSSSRYSRPTTRARR